MEKHINDFPVWKAISIRNKDKLHIFIRLKSNNLSLVVTDYHLEMNELLLNAVCSRTWWEENKMVSKHLVQPLQVEMFLRFG